MILILMPMICSGYGLSSAAYSQPVSQPSASYGVGQQQTAAQYGPYGNSIQVCAFNNMLCLINESGCTARLGIQHLSPINGNAWMRIRSSNCNQISQTSHRP